MKLKPGSHGEFLQSRFSYCIIFSSGKLDNVHPWRLRGRLLGHEEVEAAQFTRTKERAPGIPLLTDQFRNQLKSLSVIGYKNIFVPNQSPALFVLLS